MPVDTIFNPGEGALYQGYAIRPVRPGSTLWTQAAAANDPNIAAVSGYPLTNTDEPTAIRTPELGRIADASITARPASSSFNAFMDQSRRTAPQIFQGGVQSQDFAIPESMFPAGPPAGYRRTIMADGSAPVYQQILPGERTANGQDARRQGTTMAEIQQANPGASPGELLAMRSQMQNAAARAGAQNFAIRNETANRNTGVMSNADAIAQRLAASTEHRNLNEVGAQASRQRLIDAYIARGATPDELAEALSLHDQAMAHNFANPQQPAGQPVVPFVPSANQPTTTPATAPATGNVQVGNPPPLAVNPETARTRQLNQLLHQAMVGAGVPGMTALAANGPGPQVVPVPSPLATTVSRDIGNNALTNFVSALRNNGLMTEVNRPALHRFIAQNFPGHVNEWFRQGTSNAESPLSALTGWLADRPATPQQDAARAMMEYLNQGGAGIGMRQNLAGRVLSPWDQPTRR